MPSFDELSELSPNMRLALIRSDGIEIGRKDTYWITLQGLAHRGLVDRPQCRAHGYSLTEKGKAYRAAIAKAKGDV